MFSGNSININDLKVFINNEIVKEKEGYTNISKDNIRGAIRAYRMVLKHLSEVDAIIESFRLFNTTLYQEK